MNKISEIMKMKKEKEISDQLVLQKLKTNNNELIKLLKVSEQETTQLEKQLQELTVNSDLQETILIDLFSFLEKSFDRFTVTKEKTKSEQTLKKEQKLKSKMKNKSDKKKLKDLDINDDIKNIKTMINYLLDQFERTVSK